MPTKPANPDNALAVGTSGPGSAVGGLLQSGASTGGAGIVPVLQTGTAPAGSAVGGALEIGTSSPGALGVALQAGITSPVPHEHSFFGLKTKKPTVSRKSSVGMFGVYVPNNIGIYNSAVTGFLAGVHQTKYLTNKHAASYTDIVNEAEIFGQAVDNALAPGTISEAQEQVIFGMSEAESAYRYTTDSTLEDYSGVALSIIAVMTAAGSVIAPAPPVTSGPWIQTGELILPNDESASLQAVGGTATAGSLNVAFAGGVSSGINDFAIGAGSHAQSQSSVGGAVAFSDGIAFDDQAFAAIGGYAGTPRSFAVGYNSNAGANGGQGAVAFAGGVANYNNDFAVGGGSVATSVNHGYAVAFNQGEATNDYATAFGGGIASGEYSFASGSGQAIGNGAAAFGAAAAYGGFSFAAAQGSASNSNDAAFNAGSHAEGGGSLGAFAATEGYALNDAATAFSGGTSHYNYDFAAGSGSVAHSNSSGSAAAFARGQATADYAFAVGQNSIASGQTSVAFAGGEATGLGDVAFGAGSIATSLSVGYAFAAGGAAVTGDGSIGMGLVTVDTANSYKFGNDNGALFSANGDGSGSVVIQAGDNQQVAFVNVPTQTTVGAAGTASLLPLRPTVYGLITWAEEQYAIPLFAVA